MISIDNQHITVPDLPGTLRDASHHGDAQRGGQEPCMGGRPALHHNQGQEIGAVQRDRVGSRQVFDHQHAGNRQVRNLLRLFLAEVGQQPHAQVGNVGGAAAKYGLPRDARRCAYSSTVAETALSAARCCSPIRRRIAARKVASSSIASCPRKMEAADLPAVISTRKAISSNSRPARRRACSSRFCSAGTDAGGTSRRRTGAMAGVQTIAGP